MTAGKIHLPDERQAFHKFGFALAWKTGYHVGCDGNTRSCSPGGRDQFGILSRSRLTSHAAQYGRTARLQRQVQVSAQTRVFP